MEVFMQLLDFWADWCQPCKMMNPIIDEIEKDYPSLNVVRINADEDAGMVQKYNITSIPTYILINDNDEIVNFVTGAMPKYRFLKELGIENN
jgi:thioredoxin 1